VQQKNIPLDLANLPAPALYSHISQLLDIASRDIKSGKHISVRRQLMQILFLLENTASTLTDQNIVNIVLEHIHANFPSKITLDTLCKLVFVNRTTLTRMFKTYTKRTPIEYILHYRLNIACELLTHSKLSINKIAEMTGFEHASYFTRRFVIQIGITPTQYRQSDGCEVLNTAELRIVDEF